jgi:hypothetical protein
MAQHFPIAVEPEEDDGSPEEMSFDLDDGSGLNLEDDDDGSVDDDGGRSDELDLLQQEH